MSTSGTAPDVKQVCGTCSRYTDNERGGFCGPDRYGAWQTAPEYVCSYIVSKWTDRAVLDQATRLWLSRITPQLRSALMRGFVTEDFKFMAPYKRAIVGLYRALRRPA